MSHNAVTSGISHPNFDMSFVSVLNDSDAQLIYVLSRYLHFLDRFLQDLYGDVTQILSMVLFLV
jgi:hypothetical protein